MTNHWIVTRWTELRAIELQKRKFWKDIAGPRELHMQTGLLCARSPNGKAGFGCFPGRFFKPHHQLIILPHPTRSGLHNVGLYGFDGKIKSRISYLRTTDQH